MKRATQLASAVSLLLGVTAAQAADQDWQFRASLYGYIPDIGGETNFPAGGAEIDIKANDLIDNAKLVGMASFEAQHGRWGAFIDAIYMDIGDSVSDSSSLGAGQLPLPPGITADASLDITAWVITAAANYRAVETSRSSFDVFAGARLLDAKGDLDWSFNVDLSPFGGPPQSGSSEASDDKVDAIVGVKGRYQFGADGRWFIPYYFDAGTGDSDLTWQAAVGIGYSMKHGDVFAAYRHLDYDLGDGGAIANLDFDGPALGLAYRW
ncbi:MAG TPA: hypothetical protein VH814_11530 [Steroidobacteraceae bacterium]|jgi:hypothetical protein